MAAPDYVIVTIDLTVARDNQRLTEVDVGMKYNSVSIVAIPAAAPISVKFGNSKPLISLSGMSVGQGWSFKDDCGNPFYADEGLFVSNPAGAGTVQLLVSFGPAQLST